MGTPQDLIAGRYRLQRRVAAGGMGVVWEARDELLQRQVAVKQLRTLAGVAEDEVDLAKQRAMREARTAARLHHPNAVPVFDAVEHDGEPCLVMQYVPSEPLSALVKRRGPLPIGETARIGAEAAAALAAAHELGIVHRDVKPGNILIADEDGTALISDFGISHTLGDASLTSTGFMHGTPAYLAPEVARGDDSTFASDVFSLGSTLYAASEGAPPFGEAPNSIAVLHRVAVGGFQAPTRSGPLKALLLQMMASDPEARPTMRETARRLAAVAEEADDALAPTVALPSAPVDDDPDQPTAWVPLASEDAATLVVPAVGSSASVAASVASTAGGDGPREPATAAASTLLTATRTEPPAAPPPPDDAPEDADRRSRRPILLGAIVAVVLLALVGIGLRALLPAGAPEPRRTAAAAASRSPVTSASPPASSTPSLTPKPSVTPTPTATPTASPSMTPTTSPTPTPTTAPSTTAPGTSATPVRALEHYYGLMPRDTDDAWPLMTASYQTNHAGGRAAYERFWAPIRRVSAQQVRATGALSAVASITYRYTDGRVTTERTAFRFVEQGGMLRIDDSSVIG